MKSFALRLVLKQRHRVNWEIAYFTYLLTHAGTNVKGEEGIGKAGEEGEGQF